MGAAEGLTITTRDDRVLDVLVSGPPGGPVVVFHSGTPGGLVPLPAGLDPASSGIRTVLYGRPGYGRSTPQPGRSVADAASDTSAILDALGIDTFINVGWSGGGPHALACSALLGDRCVATGVIAGTGSYSQAVASSDVRDWYEADEDNQLAFAGDIDGFRKAVDGFVAQLASAKAEHIGADSKSAADRRFFADGYGEWVASFLSAAGVSGSHGAADDYLATFGDWGFSLSNVGPVIIWHGTEDQNVPPFHATWLRDHLPHVDLRMLEDEGHSSIVRHLPEFVDTLAASARSADD